MKKEDLNVVSKLLKSILSGKPELKNELSNINTNSTLQKARSSLLSIHETLSSRKSRIETLEQQLTETNQKLLKITESNSKLESEALYSENRLKDIVETSVALAQLDFSEEAYLSDNHDEFDGLSLALNMLREELMASTVSKDYLNDVFNSMTDMVIVLDDDGIIKSINNAVEKELEYTSGELIGQKSEILFEHGLSDIDVEKKLNGQYGLKSKTGKVVPVGISFSSMNKLHGTVCIARNITAKIASDKKQSELLIDLSRSNEDLEEFAYILSHDLKSPLRGISALAEWVYTDNREILDSKSNDNLELILNRSKRLYRFIEGVFDYSKVGYTSEKKEDIDLNVLVNETIDTLQVPSHVTIEIDNELPKISISKIHLTQLFQNLLSNAIKYNDKKVGKINIGSKENNGVEEFYVRDNGIGIDSKQHKKIFKIFYTVETKDTIDSTGIGLAIVKKTVGIYNGSVRVESSIGKGTAFYFSLQNPSGIL